MTSLAKWRPWSRPSELRRHRVLGINARNVNLLLELNPRRFHPALDDKVLTKGICEARDIPVPETFSLIDRPGDTRRFFSLIGERQEFVVKPARGAGGRGVVVIVGKNGTSLATSDGRTLSFADMQYHLLSTLSGLFSLGERPDRAIVEQRVVIHPAFDKLAFCGTPDVRVIVCRGVPLMAMLRLPTRVSRGRANLHQGAVGVGIHLVTGRTFGGVYRNRAVTVHPETALSVEGIEIPYWPEVLAVARKFSQAVNLGYIGVDVVLDANRGPLLLEANARPGLAIQIANRCGLLSRLAAVDQRKTEELSPSFGSQMSTPVAEVS
jgi:alpha-L-glutamate ligase-like protein